MKVFIVFIALLFIYVSFLAFHMDLGRYVQAQTFVKAIAEECAAGAALYIDEVEYSDGKLIFDYNEGREYAEYIMEESKRGMPFIAESTISYDISFVDDLQGYKDNNGNVMMGGSGTPSVTVEIEIETEDIFRLPFIEVNKVSRIAKYELPDA